MERLSKIYPSGAWGITGKLDVAILLLAAYEDTGLEPEEIILLRRIHDTINRPATCYAARRMARGNT